MNQYRKLIAAVVGVVLMLVNQKFGIDLTGLGPELENAVIAALTAAGVWGFKNEEQS